jgi:excisionase family DNA binding protein
MEQLPTVDEVVRYLRVHPMTVQRRCRVGDLPAAKIGRAYRIKKGDLDEWWVGTRCTAALASVGLGVDGQPDSWCLSFV